ncbi:MULTISPECIES: response regulator [Pseudomonas]|jgi:HD-like signal output (HDOD) protein/CheY-like chemotaxis protein|uniref:Putative response regulator, RpfG family n=1 Tax=Pseudomonas brassicacearum (strain NFM421) TaxID=994484 RepID=F2KD47_PSEBN|nr:MULTISPECIES: response regulator [Pseudomonas]EIK69885.1 response regulator [Pseudomonas fluorescens Q8r1-96]KIR14978.1 Transcriptional regulatory protein AfsQ1 [Pseudomonas fluorescens]AEA66309.1 Putative response regulator, RpfG family [Pseudomonas brassicacearum subsp. brassicacearum NFM421]ALQ00742.1 response regulator [Pseudomonas brassicacearum]AOS40093.1 histidine kinase [Pseudomonas brassicacearum]
MTAVDLPAVPRVLIAEADPASRELLEQVLSGVRCDARVDTCGDGKEALDLLAKHPYDLVIADWELPGVDGLAILRGLRQQHRTPPLPFILMSRRNDSASVREVLPLAPTAYLTKPLNRENLTQRLQGLLVGGEETSNDAPVPGPGLTLIAFLERRRDLSEGAPLMTDVQVAVKRCLNPAGLDLKLLEEEIRTDPQITGVLIAAANSAAQHQGGGPVQTVAQALHQLGTGQSMNLILGLTLKRCARLTVPCLADYAKRYWELSLHTAEYARILARLLDLEPERCYCAGLLHRLGDLALLRCLEEWTQAGGELDELEEVGSCLDQYGAGFGSALRTRWRLPLELRELIAAAYSLGGGVYSREALVMNMAAQMAHLTEHEGLEELARGRTARLLKIGLPELMRLRRK